jgi:histone H2A
MPPKGLEKKKSMSKQAKAGLTLPVSRINRTMKTSSGAKRIGGSAPVYMTAVLEYIAGEILELAGNHTQGAKRKRVTPEDIILSIRSDEELSKLCGSIAVYTGDKLTGVSDALKPAPIKEKKKAEAAATAE